MELNRLLRILADRWRIVVLLSAIGFVAAYGFASLSNQTPQDRWEALIPLRFELEEGETIDDLSRRINDAHGVALLAADGLLAQNPTFSIFTDTATGRIFFRAEGESRELALERAEELVLAYLGSDEVGGDIGFELASLAEQADNLTEQIDAMEATLTPVEQSLLRQHDILDRSIAVVEESLVQLSVADAGATPEVQQANAERRDDLNETLNELRLEKNMLPPAPSTELSIADQLRLNALQRQLEVVSLEYERLSLLEAGLLTDSRQQEAPIVRDLSPAPLSPVAMGLIGMFGGAVLAMFALALVARSRKEIWLADDLPVPTIAEVPNRKVSTLPGPSWYDATTGGRRKEAIQAARTVIDGAFGHEPATFALVGDKVAPEAIHALAVDLAASFASAGRAVLLLDADFNSSIEMAEFSVGEPSLGSVLAMPLASNQAMESAIREKLEDAVRIRSDLTVLTAGSAPSSPADALATPQFRRFLNVARQEFDLVIAVGGEVGTASSQVLSQGLGTAIVAVAPGKTTVSRIETALIDLHQQRVLLPGVVMIHGTDSKFSLPTPPSGAGRRQSSLESTPEDIASRLSLYPFPGSKRSLTPTDGSLDHLVAGLATSRVSIMDESEKTPVARGGASSDALAGEQVGRSEPDPTASKIVEEIRSMSPDRAFGPVAEYVVARIEDMMTAIPGQANVSPEMVEVANDLGYVPLTTVGRIPTAWDRLVAELTNEVGDVLGRRLATALADVLTGDADVDTRAVDEWLSQEFFRRHLERTDREPTVWHLSSPRGAIQVLVNGRRLTDSRLGRMTTDVVRRRIHELEEELKESRLNGSEERAAVIESDLKDSHLFEVSLGVLRGGSSDEARLVYPWRKQSQMPQGWNPIWSEGIRPNIAPLQKLELLPEPVLTDEELRELVPTG